MDLIRNVLDSIRRAASEHLQLRDRRGEDWVVLGNAADHGGAVLDEFRDRIVMSLYHISSEPIGSAAPATRTLPQGIGVVAAPLYVNLHLVFMANFGGRAYGDGLAAISRVIGFFQQHGVFDHATLPDLDPSVDKVAVEFVNLPLVELNYVMGMLGTRYLPSAFYKLRMLTFDARAVQARGAVMRGGAAAAQGSA